VIDVATLSVIRRWALREHYPPERSHAEPDFLAIPSASICTQPRLAQQMIVAKLDPFASKLPGWLRTEANRSRKQQRTIKQMFLDLQAMGYTGSYNWVTAFAKAWMTQRHVLSSHRGEALLCSWSSVLAKPSSSIRAKTEL
jgi:hypothetical protein